MRRGRAKGTATTAKNRLMAYAPSGDAPVTVVRPDRLQDLVDERRSLGASLATLKGEVEELLRFGRFCVDRGWLAESPAEGIERPEGRLPRGKAQLRSSEARRFLDTALKEDPERAAGALIPLLFGLRASAVLTLRVRDVDLEARILWAPRVKTDSSERPYEIPEVLLPVFEQLLDGADGEDLLLPGRRAEGRTKTWLRRLVERLCRDAGVPVVSPHGLRGTHATLGAAAGTAPALVAASLGHSDKGRTAREHYIADGTLERASARRALRVITGSPKKTPQK